MCSLVALILSVGLTIALPHSYEISSSNAKESLAEIDSSEYGSILIDLIQLQVSSPEILPEVSKLFEEIKGNLLKEQKESISLNLTTQAFCDSEVLKLKRSAESAQITISSNEYKIKFEVQPELDSKRQRKMRLEKEMDFNRAQRKEVTQERDEDQASFDRKKSILEQAIEKCEESLRGLGKTSFLAKDMTMIELQEHLDPLKSIISSQALTLLQSSKTPQIDQITELKSELESSHDKITLNSVKSLENYNKYLASLQALYLQYKNEYDNSTPKIVALEGKVHTLGGENQYLANIIKEINLEYDSLQDWCDFQRKIYFKETKIRQDKLDSVEVVKQIAVDANGEMADFIKQRISQDLPQA